MEHLLIILVTSLVNVKAVIDRPKVEESWIYTMIAFGFIGLFVILLIILISCYQRYKRNKELKEMTKHSKILSILNFTLWIFNGFACFEWAFFRSSLFIHLNIQKCTIIYISNYLFYMTAKYCLHILLLYRLYIAFSGTALMIDKKLAKMVLSIITINFIIFTSLWMQPCLYNVKVGIIVPSQSLEICTLYNNDSNRELTFYEKMWPFLFGGQDLLVGIFTLILFIYKITKLISSLHADAHDVEIETVIRKLCILGTISILSTFIFFTFAVAFYGNLTFLLPFDAMLNSLCVFLLIKYNKGVYYWICCGIDICLQKALKHKTRDISSIIEVIEHNKNSKIQLETNSNIDGSSVVITTCTTITATQSVHEIDDINYNSMPHKLPQITPANSMCNLKTGDEIKEKKHMR